MKTIEPDSFLPSENPWRGTNFQRFGLEQFVDNIFDHARIKTPYKKLGSSSDEMKEIRNKFINFLSQPETSLSTIKSRQKLFSCLIADKNLVDFLLTTNYPCIPTTGRNEEKNVTAYINMATEVVSYVSCLKRLLNKKTAFKNIKKRLEQLMTTDAWFTQLQKLSENSTDYNSATIETTIQLFSDSKPLKTRARSYGFDSRDCTLTFYSDASKVVVPGRLKGELKLTPKKGKIEIDANADEISEMMGDYEWDDLLQTIVCDFSTAKFFKIAADEKIEIGIKINVPVLDGQIITAKVTCFGKTVSYKMVRKHSEGECWILVGKKYKPSKDLLDSGIPSTLQDVRNSMLLAPCFQVIDSFSGEISYLLSEMHELLFMAATADYYSSLEGKWVFPKVLPKEAMITKLVECNNPLFVSGKICVPNPVLFNHKRTGLLITGANAGGKTAYVGSVAFAQVLAQAGLPVFAKTAILSIKNEILCHYIETNDISVNQSRYQSELGRLSNIIKTVTKYSMLIFDEPCSGTSVETGTHQVYQVLRVVAKLGCTVLMNTHYHGLIDLVSVDGTSTICNSHFLPVSSEHPTAHDFVLQPGGIRVSSGEAIAIEQKVDFDSMIEILKQRKILPSSKK